MLNPDICPLIVGGLVRVLRDAKGRASKDSNLAAAEESSPASPRSHVTKLAACRVLTTLIESMFWHEASLVANNIARESGSSARHAAVLRIFNEKHVVFVLLRLLVSQRDGAVHGSLPEQESHLTLQQGAAELLALLLDASARLLQTAALDEDEHGSSSAPDACAVQARQLHDSISAMFRECPHLFAMLREDSGDCSRRSFRAHHRTAR